MRQRLYDDFAYYAENAVKIRTKPNEKGEAKIVPLVLNRAQRHLLSVIERQLQTRGFVRICILKGRQMGSSTFVEAWLYWWVSQRKAQKALVVAHDIPSTTVIFDMTKRLHDNCPEILRPQTRYSGRKELSFGNLDSAYRIATAGGDGIVRGDMITVAHLSEFAWWPASTARENFSGLMDAIPSVPGTAVFIESTANSYNLFHEQCEQARKGDSLFEFVFLPWFWDDKYRLPVAPDFKRTPKEEELVKLYGLDNEQLMFRRAKVAEKGEDLFKQEYPNCAEEAFLTSGRPVFHPERVQDMLKSRPEPLCKMALELDGDWKEHPLGELTVFHEKDPKETYYIGADVGMGVRKDYSVAQVFDSHRRQAGIYRSDRIPPEDFGSILASLGRYYNDAQIICENNGPGVLTNHVLYKTEAYPWVYQETIVDQVTDTETKRVGFTTTVKSKPFVIGKLQSSIRDSEITIYDEETLRELQSFIVTDSGRLEAEKGTHDDTVMALALCDHINEGAFIPIDNQEDWYAEIE